MPSSLDQFRSFCGQGQASDQPRRRSLSGVRARYDAAQTSAENERHWFWADGLSASSAASPSVRQTLRNRSRYEFDNNAYLRGIARTIVGHTIGRGPQLTLKTRDPMGITNEDASAVERAFRDWMEVTGFVQKLRTMRTARMVDGEAFGLWITNEREYHPVSLDLRLIEAEQIATPGLQQSTADQVDGIRFDAVGNPIEYHLLKYHPGDAMGAGNRQFDNIPASDIIHWFTPERPDQRRGLPEMVASLPLCAYLRRYTLAVINSAEIAALHSGVIYTDAPPDDEDETEVAAMESVPVERGMFTTMPRGYKISQMKAEQPLSTYASFKAEVLEEMVRPAGVPRNIATSNSSGYNYSSGRLDHQGFFTLLLIEREQIALTICDIAFRKWLSEAVLVEGYLPDSVRRNSLTLDWDWTWDPFASIDPIKDATARKLAVDNFQQTLADGDPHWEDRLRQRARELALMAELGLPSTDPAAYPPAEPPAPEPDPEDDPSQGDNQESEPSAARARYHQKERQAERSPWGMIHAADHGRSRLVTMTTAVELTAGDPAAEGGAKLPTFSMRAYNGGLMDVGFAHPVVVDLAGLSLSRKSRPVLLEHNPANIVGHTTSIDRVEGNLDIAGVISGTGSAASEVVASAKNGFPWQASIGVRPGKVVELRRGKTAVVNGREITGPALIVRTGQFKEVSFVPLGADDATSASVAASSRKNGKRKGNTPMKTFEEFVASIGLDVNTISASQRETLQSLYDNLYASAGDDTDEGDDAPPPSPSLNGKYKKAKAPAGDDTGDDGAAAGDVLAATRAEIAAETLRITEVNRIAANHPEILAKAIELGWSKNRTELEVLRQRPKGPAITGSGSRPSPKEVYVAASLMQAGVADAFLVKEFKEPVLDAASPMRRRLSLGGLMREVLAANGVHIAPMTSNEEVLRQVVALEQRNAIQASNGPMSPISLGGILGDSAQKSMLAVLESTPVVFGRIAREVPATNFKATSVYRLESTGFRKLPPGAEMRVATLSERKSSVTLDTAAYKILLDRQEAINDDLGALLQLPAQIAENALNYVEEQSATVFLAGVGSHWAAGNSNYVSGADSTLDPDGLAKVINQFSLVKNTAGQRIGIRPSILLTPPTLYPKALGLNQSEFVVTTPAAGKSASVANVWRGRFAAEYSDFLAASNGLTNASDTAWWLLAAPQQAPALVIAYLNGQRTPTISEPRPAVNTLGLQWDVYFDFGVALGETIAGVMSKGAA
jgi:lambda family phage portal protein